jgi:hypothetical protein
LTKQLLLDHQVALYETLKCVFSWQRCGTSAVGPAQLRVCVCSCL